MIAQYLEIIFFGSDLQELVQSCYTKGNLACEQCGIFTFLNAKIWLIISIITNVCGVAALPLKRLGILKFNSIYA